jgi:hypothetical protein
MIRLTYISTAVRDLRAEAIDDILAASRRNNRRDRITGLLLHDGRRFLQMLEGEPSIVEVAYSRILKDQRHRACVKLDERVVETRVFGDWDMAWRRLDAATDAASLSETVDRMVAQVPEPNVRALFESFARIDRSAA